MQEPVDFVTLFIALFAMVTSLEVAHLVGPYAAIIVLAAAGAALALSTNKEEMRLIQAVWYICIRMILAISLTVALAEFMQAIAPILKPRYTLIPVAFGIGWIKDYSEIRTWLGSIINRWASKRVDDGK